MFDRFFQWIRQVMGKVLPTQSIYDAFGVNSVVTDRMQKNFALWLALYRDAPAESCGQSIGIPAAIASEVARTALIEFSSNITGSGGAEYLNGQYQAALKRIRKELEKGCATGNMIMKPWTNLRGNNIYVDFAMLDSFVPTQYNGMREITGGVFTDQIYRDNIVYTRLEYHTLTGREYTIRTKAFRGTGPQMLGTEINLSEVPEWADISPMVTIPGVDRPLFAVFTYPAANNIEENSPLGISCFARAVDLIAQANEQWGRILWEYEGSELAIDAAQDLFKVKNGQIVLPAGKERLYRAYDASVADGDLPINTFSPAIRDESLFNGLNEIFKRIEYNCGLSYGIISNPQTVALTATEIKYSKARFHDTVRDTQMALQYALEQLVYAMSVWARYYGLAAADNYDLSFNWDDSVLIDTETKRQLMLQDVRDGILPKWKYAMEFYDLSEADAKAMTGEDRTDNEIMGFGT